MLWLGYPKVKMKNSELWKLVRAPMSGGRRAGLPVRAWKRGGGLGVGSGLSFSFATARLDGLKFPSSLMDSWAEAQVSRK
jgi:hypothetical protein